MRTKTFKFYALLLLLLAVALPAGAQKFAILSDIHVSPGNANEGKLKEAVAEINKSDVDALIVSGDLSNEGSDVQLRDVKSILDGVTKPTYVIPGNHENNWSQSACKTFNDLWGSDRFVFQVGNLIVVGMNCGPFMKMGDGHIKQEDLIWLDQTLKEKVKPGMRVLSVNHYPILDDLDNCSDYVAVLQKYPVITHQCGHYHSWKKYVTGGIDGVIVRALDMEKGDYGYALMNVTSDSVKVFEKRLGNAPELKYAYKINLNFTPMESKAEHFTVPAGFEVKQVYADNASIFTRLGIDKDNIYFGNSLGYVKAFNKKTGKVRWQYKTAAMLFSRPAVSKKYIIMPTADHRLVWLNKADGKVVYEYKSDGPYVADGVIKNGVLYQGGFKTFQAWNVDKKTMLWHYDSIFNYCQAAPVVDGNDVYFGAWDTNLRALNAKTGRLEWSWNNGIKQNLFSPGNCVPAVTKDKVFIVAPDRFMTAFDRRSGKVLWHEHNSNTVRESQGLSEDGKLVYAKTMDGTVIAVGTDSAKYDLKWVVDAGLGYEHAPCIILEKDGVVYVGSRQGLMVAIDPATKKVLFTYRLGTSEFNGWAVDEKGDVYTSLIEGKIWKIHRTGK
jgi:outer membrane protein assembly factor BamB